MQKIYALSPITLALLLAACGGGDDNKTTNLAIPFQAKAGTTEIACGAQLTNLGLSADKATVADFAFYVHDIKFKTKTGTTVSASLDKTDFQDPQYGVALLDFQDKTDSCNGAAKPTNKVVYASVNNLSASDIVGIEFKIGVPAAANHHNASISIAPYNRSGMAWSWQSGHKFMRLDVNPSNKVQLDYALAGTNVSNSYYFHLGSTGCSGDPTTGAVVSCDDPNRPSISLSSDFKVTNLTTSKIVLDYAKLMANNNLNTDAVMPPGCMSGKTDIECMNLFDNLGMNHGAHTATGLQKVFSVAN
ncbi:MAG: metallo-mystery pair system four-Cys motif protein [Thiothrix sp.]|nr:MAG: metallo-mystery pair system four-Cys motif protein [Thiothrix sp.]